LVNIHYFASEGRWETVALDDATQQEADISDAEKQRDVSNTKLLTPIASSQNGLKSPCHAAEGERVGPERVSTLRNVPGRLSQKSLDEQASMKMSHRYYTSGVECNRRRCISNRVAAKDAESGKEDNIKHSGRKRNERAEADSKPKIRKSADVDSVKELAESSTSDDSDRSDTEFDMSSNRHFDEDAEESFREMVLQKYLVMLPGKAKKMVRASADTKQKEARCKCQATTGEPHCRKFSGKNMHSVSPSRRQKFQLRKSSKKNPYSSSVAPHTRPSVSQPAGALQANMCAAEVAPREEESETEKSCSPVAFLKKSWSTGDLHHSKSLGDIGTLKGHAHSHREMEKSLSEQEKHTTDFELPLAKNSKASLSEASQTLVSGERCFAMAKMVVQHEEKICPQHTSEGQHKLTNSCIRSMEVSTTATADFPLTSFFP